MHITLLNKIIRIFINIGYKFKKAGLGQLLSLASSKILSFVQQHLLDKEWHELCELCEKQKQINKMHIYSFIRYEFQPILYKIYE